MSQKFCNRDLGGVLVPPYPHPPKQQPLSIILSRPKPYLTCALAILLLFVGGIEHAAAKAPPQKDLIKRYQLEPCNEAELAIEFLCNPAWEYHVSKDALLVVISKEPLVTATFARMDAEVNYLYQLNKNTLAKKNLYRKGFKADLKKVNGQDVMVVRAFSRSEPQRRVLDFFYIHQGELFGALFAVHPIDNWDDYKFLIKAISESIQLLETKDDGAA